MGELEIRIGRDIDKGRYKDKLEDYPFLIKVYANSKLFSITVNERLEVNDKTIEHFKELLVDEFRRNLSKAKISFNNKEDITRHLAIKQQDTREDKLQEVNKILKDKSNGFNIDLLLEEYYPNQKLIVDKDEALDIISRYVIKINVNKAITIINVFNNTQRSTRELETITGISYSRIKSLLSTVEKDLEHIAHLIISKDTK